MKHCYVHKKAKKNMKHFRHSIKKIPMEVKESL